jgi:hypothetical protein
VSAYLDESEMSSETGFDPEALRPLSDLGAASGRANWKSSKGSGAAPKGWQLVQRDQQQLHRRLLHRRGACCSSSWPGCWRVLMRTQLALPMKGFLATGDLQPDLHGPWHDDDVPVRGPGGGSARRAAAAPDAWRARPAVSAAERLRLLGLSDRRPRLLLLAVLRPGAERRLVHVSAADQRSPIRRESTPTSGCSASASSRSRAIAGAIEIIVGVLRNRAPGMTPGTDCRSSPGPC